MTARDVIAQALAREGAYDRWADAYRRAARAITRALSEVAP